MLELLQTNVHILTHLGTGGLQGKLPRNHDQHALILVQNMTLINTIPQNNHGTPNMSCHNDPVHFIRNLFFGEGFRFLNFSILKAWNSLIHRNPFLNFQSARTGVLHPSSTADKFPNKLIGGIPYKINRELRTQFHCYTVLYLYLVAID